MVVPLVMNGYSWHGHKLRFLTSKNYKEKLNHKGHKGTAIAAPMTAPACRQAGL